MGRNTSVSLDEHSADFVDSQIKNGHYQSADDVLRAGLRLLEANEAKVPALEAALIEGEESGEPTEFDNAAFLARMHARHAE